MDLLVSLTQLIEHYIIYTKVEFKPQTLNLFFLDYLKKKKFVKKNYYQPYSF